MELFPRRTNNVADMAYLMKHLQYEDPYDEMLYNAARQMFQEEIAYVKQWKNVSL